MITAAQCRAARGLLDWSQDDLATKSKTSNSTVRNFEKGRSIPGPLYQEAMQGAFEDAGIEFLPENGQGAGVRLKK